MKKFTYKEYIYYKELLKNINTKNNFQLMEDEEKYIYEEKQPHQPHDKIFKEILDDKEEAINFINENLKLSDTKYKLKMNDIEKYNRKFITQNFSNMESDVIYKKTDQNIFFLIEHQSTIDYSMPYRILKYNMAIMESSIDKSKVKNKNYKLPCIYSFVIYTGNKKWNADSYILEKQESLIGVKKNLFANFEVIDVNNYTKEELLTNKSLISKMMLLEKAKNIDELEEYLQKILEKELEEKQIVFIERVINLIFKDKITKERYSKMIAKKRREKGEKIMFVEILSNWIDEMLKKEEKFEAKEQEFESREQEFKAKEREFEAREKRINKMDKALKDKENQLAKREHASIDNIAMEMLKSKMDDNTIIKILKIDKNELIRIKNENNLAIVQETIVKVV